MLTLMLMLATMSGDDGVIHLTCGGGGAANKIDSDQAYATNNNGKSAWATVQSHRSEGFEDQVDLVIDGPDSRIRLPRIMLPVIHGGEGGWFKMKDVTIESTRITGSAAVNFANNPKIFVDRQTGRISIDGKAGHYSGQCERAASSDQPTKF